MTIFRHVANRKVIAIMLLLFIIANIFVNFIPDVEAVTFTPVLFSPTFIPKVGSLLVLAGVTFLTAGGLDATIFDFWSRVNPTVQNYIAHAVHTGQTILLTQELIDTLNTYRLGLETQTLIRSNTLEQLGTRWTIAGSVFSDSHRFMASNAFNNFAFLLTNTQGLTTLQHVDIEFGSHIVRITNVLNDSHRGIALRNLAGTVLASISAANLRDIRFRRDGNNYIVTGSNNLTLTIPSLATGRALRTTTSPQYLTEIALLTTTFSTINSTGNISLDTSVSAIPQTRVGHTVTALPAPQIIGANSTSIPVSAPQTAHDISGTNSLLGGISTILTNVWTGIISLPQAIANAIQIALGFVLSPVIDLLNTVSTTLIRFFDFSIPINFQPLVGLGQQISIKFPFSLPFDLLRAFQSFNISSQAIIFPIQINDGLLGNINIQIDLSKFNTLIQISRSVQLLLFSIGLILLTPKVMKI